MAIVSQFTIFIHKKQQPNEQNIYVLKGYIHQVVGQSDSLHSILVSTKFI